MTLLAEKPIDGTLSDDASTPIGALNQFYRAFNGRDLALMKENWEQSEDASMDNPLGGIKRGWNEIQPLYERIFTGEATVRVEFLEYTLHQTAEVFWAVGRETGALKRGDCELELAIRTSRLYRRDSTGGWRQVHHHGSMDDPLLLARYQAAVL